MKIWVKGSWRDACTLYKILTNSTKTLYETQNDVASLNPDQNYIDESDNFGGEIRPTVWILNMFFSMGDGYTVNDLQKLIDRGVKWKAES